jgi:hypothetical protein
LLVRTNPAIHPSNPAPSPPAIPSNPDASLPAQPQLLRHLRRRLRASPSPSPIRCCLLFVPYRAQLFTWGRNQRGMLGHPPETKMESSAGPVDALVGVKIVQVRLSSALPARFVSVTMYC